MSKGTPKKDQTSHEQFFQQSEEMKPEVRKVLEQPPLQNSWRKASVVLKVEHDHFTGDCQAMQGQGLHSPTTRLLLRLFFRCWE